MRRTSGCLLLAATLAGCGVSRSLYLQKESELTTCRANVASGDAALVQCRQGAETQKEQRERVDKDLESCLSQKAPGTAELEECRKQGVLDLAACREAVAKADAELSKTREDVSSCRKENEASTKEIEGLKARETELRDRLEKEIREQTVEIERLLAKLSVRVVDHILFDSGSAEILKEGKVVLDKVAGVLAGTNESVRVEGHSDDVPVSKRLKGKFYSNWELSAARAANVVRYFQYAKSVEPARMEAVGLAQYRPDAPNDTFEGRAQNRRVVIVLTPAKDGQVPRAPRTSQDGPPPSGGPVPAAQGSQ